MGGANCPLLTGRRRAIVSGHMVTRRWFLAGSAALLTAPLAAEAQLSAKVYRIGYVSPGAPATFIEGFRRGLQDLGYREGENIVVDYRSADGSLIGYRTSQSHRQELWIEGRSSDGLLPRLLRLDLHSVLETNAGAHERDELGRIDAAPMTFGHMQQLERHHQPG